MSNGNFHLIGAILGIVSLVASITYLGPTFDSKPAMEVNDWRRKLLLFLAWFNMVYYIIMLISMRNLARNEKLSIVFTLLAEIVIITYLGPTFEHSEKIDVNDWRRKFTLFFSWLAVAMIGVSLLPLVVALPMLLTN